MVQELKKNYGHALEAYGIVQFSKSTHERQIEGAAWRVSGHASLVPVTELSFLGGSEKPFSFFFREQFNKYKHESRLYY